MANIMWTDSEWTKLTDLIELMRLNDVNSGLVSLVNKAQEQLPRDRRRKILASSQIQPLIEELTRRYDGYRTMKDQIQSLQMRLQNIESGQSKPLSKSEILDNCTPQELLSRLSVQQIFQNVPLEDLVSEAGRRLAVALTERQPALVQESTRPIIDQDQVRRKGTKRICVLGPISNQQETIRRVVGSICDLTFVDSANDRIPENQHFYINWTNFSSHAREEKCRSLCSSPDQYIRYSGGVNNLIVKIQEVITKE